MLGCIALVAGPGARLALLEPMLGPLAELGGYTGMVSGPELVAAVLRPDLDPPAPVPVRAAAGAGEYSDSADWFGAGTSGTGRASGLEPAAAGAGGVRPGDPGGWFTAGSGGAGISDGRGWAAGGPAGSGGVAPVPAGAGPVCSGDGRWVLCFSGRLDNLAELHAALVGVGRSPAGYDEPAVVLAAFLAWGEGAVRQLRGDWALALADQACGSVYLARDPLGGRPLYWSQGEDCLLVASQVKSLVPAGQPVHEVPPAQHGWAEPGTACDLVPFADRPGLGPALPPLTDLDLATDLIRDSLREAVAVRAGSGPLGVVLTGGVTGGAAGHGGDGSGLASGNGLAAAIIARVVSEFRPDCVLLSAGPAGSREVELARRLAEDLGLRHEAVDVPAGRAQRAAAQEAIQLCELTGDAGISAAITLLPVLRRARELGLSAVLTSDGGPGLFGGPELFGGPGPAGDHGPSVREVLPCGCELTDDDDDEPVRHGLLGRHGRAGRRKRSGRSPAGDGSPAAAYGGFWSDGDNVDVDVAWPAPETGPDGDAWPAVEAAREHGRSAAWPPVPASRQPEDDHPARQGARRFHERARAIVQLLDRVSVATGTEIRMPFLDLSLVYLGLRIPPELRSGDGLPDWLLRYAFGRQLPGYMVPGHRASGPEQRRRPWRAARGRAARGHATEAPLSPQQAGEIYQALGYDLLKRVPQPASPSTPTSPATPAAPVAAPELHFAQARP